MNGLFAQNKDKIDGVPDGTLSIVRTEIQVLQAIPVRTLKIRDKDKIDGVSAAPRKIPVPLTASARFTSGFEMGPGGTKPVWPSTNQLP